MSRYIDADKIEYYETRVYDGYDTEGSEYYKYEKLAYKTDIDKMPTADVVEVRHGEWIKQIRDYGKYCITEGFECSICGLELMDNDYNYCPECGADMRGERRKERK